MAGARSGPGGRHGDGVHPGRAARRATALEPSTGSPTGSSTSDRARRRPADRPGRPTHPGLPLFHEPGAARYGLAGALARVPGSSRPGENPGRGNEGRWADAVAALVRRGAHSIQRRSRPGGRRGRAGLAARVRAVMDGSPLRRVERRRAGYGGLGSRPSSRSTARSGDLRPGAERVPTADFGSGGPRDVVAGRSVADAATGTPLTDQAHLTRWFRR